MDYIDIMSTEKSEAEIYFDLDKREFRRLPEWFCEKWKYPVLRKLEVTADGAVRTVRGIKRGRVAGGVYLWSTPETCADFGYMQCQTYPREGERKTGWWLAKAADGYYLYPSAWRRENKGHESGYGSEYRWSSKKYIRLSHLVAAAWCERKDDQDCVYFRDGDRFNVKAENLVWGKHGEHKRKFEWKKSFAKMTAQQIVDEAAKQGVKISKLTAYRYKKEHGAGRVYTTDEEILAMYDPSLTQVENVRRMTEAGLKVTQPRLSVLLKYTRKNSK